METTIIQHVILGAVSIEPKESEWLPVLWDVTSEELAARLRRVGEILCRLRPVIEGADMGLVAARAVLSPQIPIEVRRLLVGPAQFPLDSR